MPIKKLEEDWMMLREVYFDGVEFRYEDYKEFGFTRNKDFVLWEDEMNEALGVLRSELIRRNPEKFHFGKFNKCTEQKYHNINKYSVYGDNGYYSCFGCHRLFLVKDVEKIIKKVNNGRTGRKKKSEEMFDSGCFLKCCFHKDLKPIGQMQLKREELVWL